MAEALSSITFSFPYHEVSGVPVLFARMARHLAERCGLETRVVDYRDGYMFRVLADCPRVRKIEFVRGRPIDLGGDTVLVLQSVLPYAMRPELHLERSTRIVFWTLHPLNWVPTILPMGWFRQFQARHPGVNRWMMRSIKAARRNAIRALLADLARKRSVVFMDGATLRSTCQLLDVRIDDPVYVPVPCNVPPTNQWAAGPRPSRDGISFGWVGRLGDFKTHPLVHMMEQLSMYASRTRAQAAIYVIGTGPQAGMLDRAAIDPRWLRVVRAGVLDRAALDRYLLGHVDVLAAMGASALEGAKLGIPTILLDPFFTRVPRSYGFRWLFESSEYGLGEYVEAAGAGQRGRPLEALIASLRDHGREISDRTYRYCREHHAIELVAEGFVRTLGEASFQYGDIRPEMMRKGTIRKGIDLARWVMGAGHQAGHARRA